MLIIEDWWISADDNPYKAPEIRNYYLQGFVYNHSTISDGKFIKSSKIVNIDIPNGLIKTYSGSEYNLGQANLEWTNWLKEINYDKNYIDMIEKFTSYILN